MGWGGGEEGRWRTCSVSASSNCMPLTRCIPGTRATRFSVTWAVHHVSPHASPHECNVVSPQHESAREFAHANPGCATRRVAAWSQLQRPQAWQKVMGDLSYWHGRLRPQRPQAAHAQPVEHHSCLERRDEPELHFEAREIGQRELDLERTPQRNIGWGDHAMHLQWRSREIERSHNAREMHGRVWDIAHRLPWLAVVSAAPSWT